MRVIRADFISALQRVEKVDTLAGNASISCTSQNLRAKLCLAT